MTSSGNITDPTVFSIYLYNSNFTDTQYNYLNVRQSIAQVFQNNSKSEAPVRGLINAAYGRRKIYIKTLLAPKPEIANCTT